MSVVALDIGTSNTKAALFRDDGSDRAFEHRPTSVRTANDRPYYDPEDLFGAVGELVSRVGAIAEDIDDPVTAVGVTSMSETGLLADRADGTALTPFLPWFDLSAQQATDEISRYCEAGERFARSGLHPSAKYGLSKIVRLRDTTGLPGRGSVWLSVADYVVFRLTGRIATSPSLAARTYAYSLKSAGWDLDLIESLGLPAAMFPDIVPSLQPVAPIRSDLASRLRIPGAVPVANAGHDHVSAAFALCLRDDIVLDSMGTAEAVLGMIPLRQLGRKEMESGLAFGPSVMSERLFWLGGIPSSGSAVEWVRTLLREAKVDDTSVEPSAGAPHFLPYLKGSGAPMPDGGLRGAFFGLGLDHGPEDIMKAVLEGTAYEADWIRRTAEAINGISSREILLSGGGSRNDSWVRTKAEIYGVKLRVCRGVDASLRGAALAALVALNEMQDAREIDEVRERWSRAVTTDVHEPVTTDRDLYVRRYARFRRLRELVSRDRGTGGEGYAGACT